MAVIGVFAETNIGDDEKLGQLAFDLADRLLNDAVVVVRLAADRVLVLGQTE